MTVEATTSTPTGQETTTTTPAEGTSTTTPADGGTGTGTDNGGDGDKNTDGGGSGSFVAGGGAKGADGSKGDPGGETTGPVDGELEIKLPEGVNVDETMFDGFKEAATKSKLNSEQASEVATWYANQVEEAVKAQVAQAEAQDKEYQKQLQSDPDIGGQKFNESQALAQQAVERFGGNDLITLLEQHNLGNHPAIAKTFVRIGREFKEDTTHTGRHGGEAKGSTAEERLAKMYPTTAGKANG